MSVPSVHELDNDLSNDYSAWDEDVALNPTISLNLDPITLTVGDAASGLPARQRVRTASRLKKTPGRLDFQRGVLQRNADGELEVTTTGHQGSHIFSSFSLGNCFIVLERDRGNVEVGCDFCGQQYQFDAIDAARLFTDAQIQPPSSSSVQ